MSIIPLIEGVKSLLWLIEEEIFVEDEMAAGETVGWLSVTESTWDWLVAERLCMFDERMDGEEEVMKWSMVMAEEVELVDKVEILAGVEIGELV